MHNKQMHTPPKNIRSYLDILQSSSRKRKSIFSRDRTPSTSKTLRSKDHLRTQPRTLTEPIEHRTTQDLVTEMTQLLGNIKAKYNIYVKAEDDNVHLRKENVFLKEELARLRRQMAENTDQVEMSMLRERNMAVQERFARARKQLKDLKRTYAHDKDLTLDFDEVLEVLKTETDAD